MHEYTLARKILKAAEEAAQGKKITSITLDIGELADIPAKDLADVLRHMTGCTIDYTETEGIVKCSCGYTGKAKILEKKHSTTIFVCPKCSKKPEVISGNDVVIKEIEVDG